MFSVLALHENTHLTDECVQLINDEWPRSKAARLFSLNKSCSTLPYSLVLVENEKTVVGYCRQAKVINDTNSVLIESVVVDKKRRGQGLGRCIMELAEQHAVKIGYCKVYLCTKDKQDFYQHLGYSYCKPVNTFGARMLATCDCASETNTPFPDQPACGKTCSSGCSSSKGPSKAADSRSESSSSLDSVSSGVQRPCHDGCNGSDEKSNAKSLSPDLRECESTPKTLPPPPPPPPPPLPAILPSVIHSTQVIYWMMKEIA